MSRAVESIEASINVIPVSTLASQVLQTGAEEGVDARMLISSGTMAAQLFESAHSALYSCFLAEMVKHGDHELSQDLVLSIAEVTIGEFDSPTADGSVHERMLLGMRTVEIAKRSLKQNIYFKPFATFSLNLEEACRGES